MKAEEQYPRLKLTHDARMVAHQLYVTVWSADRCCIGERLVTIRQDGRCRVSVGGRKVTVSIVDNFVHADGVESFRYTRMNRKVYVWNQ